MNTKDPYFGVFIISLLLNGLQLAIINIILIKINKKEVEVKDE